MLWTLNEPRSGTTWITRPNTASLVSAVSELYNEAFNINNVRAHLCDHNKAEDVICSSA